MWCASTHWGLAYFRHPCSQKGWSAAAIASSLRPCFSCRASGRGLLHSPCMSPSYTQQKLTRPLLQNVLAKPQGNLAIKARVVNANLISGSWAPTFPWNNSKYRCALISNRQQLHDFGANPRPLAHAMKTISKDCIITIQKDSRLLKPAFSLPTIFQATLFLHSVVAKDWAPSPINSSHAIQPVTNLWQSLLPSWNGVNCLHYIPSTKIFPTTFQMHHNGRAGDEKLPKHIRKYILRYVTLWLVVLKSHNVMQCNVCNVLQHFFHDSKASCFKWPWHSPQCWSKRDTWSCCCTRWLSANPKIFGI